MNVESSSKGGSQDDEHLPQSGLELQERLHDWGWNTVRFLMAWGAVEPEPDTYDDAYLDDVETWLDWYAENDIHVVLDFHQDLYGWKVGGNGAPDWAVLTDGIEFALLASLAARRRAVRRPPGGDRLRPDERAGLRQRRPRRHPRQRPGRRGGRGWTSRILDSAGGETARHKRDFIEAAVANLIARKPHLARRLPQGQVDQDHARRRGRPSTSPESCALRPI